MTSRNSNWQRVLDRFDNYQRAAGLSKRTVSERRMTLERFAQFVQLPPTLVDLEHCIDYLNRPHARTGGDLSLGTKQVERSYLQVWGDWMVLDGQLAINPAARLPKVRVPRRQARPVHLAHIERLLAEPLWQQTLDLIVILATTGLRVGEAVQIRGEDYDPITGFLGATRKGGLRHDIPLNESAREVAERMPSAGWWFPSPCKNSKFPNGGGHILMKSASTKITAALRRIGVTDPTITGHSIRHFFASHLISKGVRVQVVQQLLGHASLATTQMYIEVQQQALVSGVAELPRFSASRHEVHNKVGPNAVGGSFEVLRIPA
ncbi:integrase/recombinase XerD [Mycolicibacterium mucogenicum 261Sha1.1M5]|nr:integrase/recombinase XerD [Mycolicibacterium mucogenicum 261Sha1.1M5]